MENFSGPTSTPSSPNQPKLLNFWQRLSTGKKVTFVGSLLVVGLVVLFFVSIILTSLNDARSTGMSGMSSSESFSDSVSFNSYLRVPSSQKSVDTSYDSAIEATAFEAKSYNATYRTSVFPETCDSILGLKGQTGIFFSSSNIDKYSCSFNFSVGAEQLNPTLDFLRKLQPNNLTEQISNIKKQYENNLNQKDILLNSLAQAEKTINEAIASYNHLQAVAEANSDSMALATAVREKLDLIDRLQQRQETARQQIDAINRQLADQEERLQNTNFSVSVTKVTYFDYERIKNSWQAYVSNTVTTLNEVLQKTSLGLVSFVASLAFIFLYGLIIVIFAKFCWQVIKRIWKR